MKKHEREAIFEILLGFPKSLALNFRCLPFKQAIKLPLLVSHHVYLRTIKGKIEINSPVHPAMVLWGIGNVGIFDKKRSRSIIELKKDSKIILKGKARFGNGTKISVDGGTLSFGKNFTMTAESSIYCCKEIHFGDDCLVSWECLFMDTDVHKIIKDDIQVNKDKPISIGNHVWIGARSTILKGSRIHDDTVVAARSLVTSDFDKNNIIVGGSPAKILSSEICWER